MTTPGALRPSCAASAPFRGVFPVRVRPGRPNEVVAQVEAWERLKAGWPDVYRALIFDVESGTRP